MSKKISKKEAISYGWKSYKKNAFILSGLLVLIYIVQNISNYLIKTRYIGRGEVDVSNVPPENLFSYFILIVVAGSIISTMTKVGLLKVSLIIYRGEKARFKDFFSDVRSYITFFLASSLYMLIFILVVLLYLIVALILNYFIELTLLIVILPLLVLVYIVEVSFIFYGYLIVDNKSTVIKSFEESEKLINGNRAAFSLFLIYIILINLIGVVTIIGNLITIPISLMATTHIYMKLSDSRSMEVQEEVSK